VLTLASRLSNSIKLKKKKKSVAFVVLVHFIDIWVTDLVEEDN
jgi:hypothetical protein